MNFRRKELLAARIAGENSMVAVPGIIALYYRKDV